MFVAASQVRRKQFNKYLETSVLLQFPHISVAENSFQLLWNVTPVNSSFQLNKSARIKINLPGASICRSYCLLNALNSQIFFLTVLFFASKTAMSNLTLAKTQ